MSTHYVYDVHFDSADYPANVKARGAYSPVPPGVPGDRKFEPGDTISFAYTDIGQAPPAPVQATSCTMVVWPASKGNAPSPFEGLAGDCVIDLVKNAKLTVREPIKACTWKWMLYFTVKGNTFVLPDPEDQVGPN